MLLIVREYFTTFDLVKYYLVNYDIAICLSASEQAGDPEGLKVFFHHVVKGVVA